MSMNFSKKNLTRSDLSKETGDVGFGMVAQFDFSEFRERDWQNVLTCQDKSKAPFLWSSANHAISKVPVEALLPKVRVTSVAVSSCGNFGVVGYENGSIQKFNMQSGKDRGMFINKMASETLH
jgi:U3 small nucleolar RNA-associated protein 21